jgi:dihydroflavonol-4-reductase
MKVLVTGSTGFLGSQLCGALVQAGYDVRAFHRSTSITRQLDDLPIEHAIGDLTQPDTLRAAMQGVEVVFHAAASLGGHEKAGRMYAVTVEGTRAVLQAAHEAGVRRIVHTSSVAALGIPDPIPHPNRDTTGPSQGLLNETHTWNTTANRWMYGYTKYLAELEVQRAVAAGQDAVIVNPSLVFGPGDIYRQSSSLIVQVARQRLPALVDGGVNVVHIADVVAGHIEAMKCGRTGERYILGGHNLSIVDLVHSIAAVVKAPVPVLLLPAPLVRAMAGPAGLLESYLDTPIDRSILTMAGLYFFYDIRKAQVDLGLPPPRPAEQAFSEAYEWFKGVGAVK